jgi:hypothetical protein
MTPAELVAAVEGHGFRFAGASLKAAAKGAVLPPDLLAELRCRRLEVLGHLDGCEVCGRYVAPEDAGPLSDCALCDRSACPHKPTRRR